jgi:hypothetical protein
MIKLISNKDPEFFFKYTNSLMDLYNKQKQMDFTEMLNKFPIKNSNEIYEWKIMGRSAK